MSISQAVSTIKSKLPSIATNEEQTGELERRVESDIQEDAESGVSEDEARNLIEEHEAVIEHIEESEEALSRIADLEVDVLKRDKEEIEALVEMREEHLEKFREFAEGGSEIPGALKKLESEMDKAVLGFKPIPGARQNGFAGAIKSYAGRDEITTKKWYRNNGSSWADFRRWGRHNFYVDTGAVSDLIEFRKGCDSSYGPVVDERNVLSNLHRAEVLDVIQEKSDLEKLDFAASLFTAYRAKNSYANIPNFPDPGVWAQNSEELSEILDNLTRACEKFYSLLREINEKERETIGDVEELSEDTAVAASEVVQTAKEVEELLEEIRNAELEKHQIEELLQHAAQSDSYSISSIEQSELESIAEGLQGLVSETEENLEFLEAIGVELENLKELTAEEKSGIKGLANDWGNGVGPRPDQIVSDDIVNVADLHARIKRKMFAIREIHHLLSGDASSSHYDGLDYEDLDYDYLDDDRYRENLDKACQEVLILVESIIDLVDYAAQRLEVYDREETEITKGIRSTDPGNIENLKENIERAANNVS